MVQPLDLAPTLKGRKDKVHSLPVSSYATCKFATRRVPAGCCDPQTRMKSKKFGVGRFAPAACVTARKTSILHVPQHIRRHLSPGLHSIRAGIVRRGACRVDGGWRMVDGGMKSFYFLAGNDRPCSPHFFSLGTRELLRCLHGHVTRMHLNWIFQVTGSPRGKSVRVGAPDSTQSPTRLTPG